MRSIGAEDYVVLVAFALSVALTALICVEVQHGQGMTLWSTLRIDIHLTLSLGRHYSSVSPEELKEMNKVITPNHSSIMFPDTCFRHFGPVFLFTKLACA